MKDSTIIEFRLDSYGDDLIEVIEGLNIPALRAFIKGHIYAGNDLGLLEHLTTTISGMDKSKPPVLPTHFREYCARLMFMDSVNADCRSCQNYLVRTSKLAEELLRFPNNPNLLAALRVSDDVVIIKARIWSAQPGHVWTRDLGLLLGMSGEEFGEKMAAGAKQYETYRAGRS